jgi:hypothetical protein
MRRLRTSAPSSIPAFIATSVAIIIVALDMPAALRIPAMVVLLWVPGTALARLLTGNVTSGHGDRALRIPLSVLFGILSWLAVALLLNVCGIPLGPRSLALGAGATGLVLVSVAGVQHHPARDATGPLAVAEGVTKTLRSGAGVAVTALVVAAATCCAAMMITKPVDRYTMLGFRDSKPFNGEVPNVTRGKAVRLNWVLRGVGCDPSPTLTSVRLTVDGKAVGDIAVDIDDDRGEVLTGAVTFTAPITPGRHMVELTALPTADDGTALPAPGYVSTYLEVGQ